MYQFIGDATGTDGLDFQPLFAEYENNPGETGKCNWTLGHTTGSPS